VTVVDEDVDIYDMNDVMWAILTRSRPDRDTIIIPDTPTFYRDPHRDHGAASVPTQRRHTTVVTISSASAYRAPTPSTSLPIFDRWPG
jgi:hypothetical protein